MVWRSVIVSKPAKLKREHFALVVEQEQSARVPFEDIAVIVLNHREITLTHPVLSACAEYGIGMYSTGDNHQPNGVFGGVGRAITAFGGRDASILIRPCEVLSRVANVTILEVANNALRVLLQHRHVIIGSLA